MAAAFAATAPTASRCTSLQKQFNQEIVAHGSAPEAASAKKLYTQAAKLCKTGKYKSGVGKLETALKEIGAKPQM